MSESGRAMKRSMSESVLFNTHVITMDARQPKAEAILVREDKIAYVGGKEEALKRSGSAAMSFDLNGRTLVPGFNDSHIHAAYLGDVLSAPTFTSLDGEQILARLKEKYFDVRPGKPIFVYGWSPTICSNLNRSMLDAAFPENPVMLFQNSGHALYANSECLAKMDISLNSDDPPGTKPLRNASNEPTGVVLEPFNSGYMRRLFAKRQMNRVLNRKMLKRVLEEFRKFGITSVQDNTWFHTTVSSLSQFFKDRNLTCRFSCWQWGSVPWWKFLMKISSYREPWFYQGPQKYVIDGAFSTHTAWLSEPYSDEVENFGDGKTQDEISKILTPIVKRKGQAAFHAIGDRTISEFLDACENLQKEYPALKKLRLRLEHAQLINPKDIPRMKKLGVLVSAQPSALRTRQNDIVLLGEERARQAYPYRSLLDEGIHLSFGSDAPSETTVDPLQSIHYVVNREGKERITPFEALYCYTMGSAYAEFREHEKGSITPGKFADLTVLSEDILSVDPCKIQDVSVEMTMIGGMVVYEKDASTASAR